MSLLINPYRFAAAPGGGGGAYSAEVMADSPLAYYRLGEASGTVMADSSGNGRDGAYSGGVALGAAGLLAGDVDTCVDFTAGQGRVTAAAWMDVPAITAEALVELDSVASISMILERDNQGGGGGGRCFQFRVADGKLDFVAFTSGGIVAATSTATLVAATKYHVAATYDGANIRLYVNGVLDKTTAIAGTLNTGAQDLLVGRSSIGFYPLDGRIDEVAIFGSALAGARVAAHAAAT